VASELSAAGVQHFFTMNEIRTFVELGYGNGIHAPGLQVGRKRLAQLNHYALLGHGLSVQAIRAHAVAGTQVGLAENPIAPVPVTPSEADIAAARVAMREENASYLTAILEGRYTERYLASLGEDPPHFTAEEMRAISAPLDALGLNFYTSTYVRASHSPAQYEALPLPADFPRMASSWLTVSPECLHWGPRLVHECWKPKAIYITENGCSANDTVSAGGEVLDTGRTMYLRNCLSQLGQALAEGAPVKGYFVWSLLDNFEWADGYEKRFGIVHVDFKTQKRTPKLSAEFYRAVIGGNGRDL
jgi:beta-glucosidase